MADKFDGLLLLVVVKKSLAVGDQHRNGFMTDVRTWRKEP